MDNKIFPKHKFLSNNLKKYRVWKGLTQEQLSKEININITTLRLIEFQKRSPKYIIRNKICKFFNVSQTQMFYIKE